MCTHIANSGHTYTQIERYSDLSKKYTDGDGVLNHFCLFETPWTVTHQAPLPTEFSRQEYWSGLPFPTSGNLPDPWIESVSCASCIVRQILNQQCHLGSPNYYDWGSLQGLISRIWRTIALQNTAAGQIRMKQMTVLIQSALGPCMVIYEKWMEHSCNYRHKSKGKISGIAYSYAGRVVMKFWLCCSSHCLSCTSHRTTEDTRMEG